MWSTLLLTTLLLLVLTAVVSAQEDSGAYRIRAGPNYGRPGPVGYAPGGPYPGYTNEESENLDALDKLYSRLDSVQDELKTGSEILANLQSRLSLHKKSVDELAQLTFPQAAARQNNQETRINQLLEMLSAAEDAADALEAELDDLDNDVNNTLNHNADIQSRLAALNQVDIQNDRNVALLLSYVEGIKDILLQIIGTQFQVFHESVEKTDQLLEIAKDKEKRRMCEAGQVTLDRDDRKAEYLFQSTFETVPQVSYSVCGYNFNLNARKKAYTDYREPNAIGLLVTANPTKTGVKFEVSDQSFGDTQLSTADVCFQVCSIDAGVRLVTQEMPPAMPPQ